jgi:hypothetical protein
VFPQKKYLKKSTPFTPASGGYNAPQKSSDTTKARKSRKHHSPSLAGAGGGSSLFIFALIRVICVIRVQKKSCISKNNPSLKHPPPAPPPAGDTMHLKNYQIQQNQQKPKHRYTPLAGAGGGSSLLIFASICAISIQKKSCISKKYPCLKHPPPAPRQRGIQSTSKKIRNNKARKNQNTAIPRRRGQGVDLHSSYLRQSAQLAFKKNHVSQKNIPV